MKCRTTAILAMAMVLSFCLALRSEAALKAEKVEYKQGSTVLTGYLVYEDGYLTARPGVLVVHEWWGLNDYAKKRAEDLAREGYIALAVDMYGGGKTTSHPKEAGEWATALQSVWVHIILTMWLRQPLKDSVDCRVVNRWLQDAV